MENTKKQKIYIVAPAGMTTGGVELLHQLGATLNGLGLSAFMYYIPESHSLPVHSRYKHYNVPTANNIIDKACNIIIVPEVYDYFVFLNKFSNIKKWVWWLSVDNFYAYYYFGKHKVKNFILRVLNRLSKIIFKKPAIDFSKIAVNACKNLDLLNNPLISKINLHLVQSHYAKKHLESKGIKNIEYLSDYLNDEFLSYNYGVENKENLVLYNPNKGFKFTDKIIANVSGVKFLPIKNMSKKEVIDLMKKAKVYIDFGNHPGKDRLPREAAICGCCVITGKRGSAGFYEDVSLSDEYKFDDKIDSIPKISNAIKECINNYGEVVKDFDNYREFIKKDKNKFIEDVKRIFLTNASTAK